MVLGASRSSAEQPCTPLDNCAGQIDLHPALSDRDERKDGIGHAAPACWTLSACSQRQNWAHRLRHSRSDRLLQLFLCGQASSNSSTPKTTVRRTDSVADEAGSGRRPLRPCVSQPYSRSSDTSLSVDDSDSLCSPACPHRDTPQRCSWYFPTEHPVAC